MTSYALQALKEDYKNGRISKGDYIIRMHDLHRILFEYADFIKGTDIARIEITDGTVLMKMRNSNIRMVCDKDDRRIAPVEILNFDNYEKEDFRMVMDLVEQQHTIFDIGGNFGWYAINIGESYPSATVHTFEPIPKTFSYLKRNVELNGLGNVNVYNYGFSNKEQDLTFYYYPEGSGNASLANLSQQDDVQTITCHVKTLDDFVRAKKHRIDLIKCDVEGAELFVFQGGVQTLKEQTPIIFTELLRKWSAKFNYHPNDVLNLLRELGYRCFIVLGGKLQEFDLVDDDTTATNFFFLHPKKHEDKIRQYS